MRLLAASAALFFQGFFPARRPVSLSLSALIFTPDGVCDSIGRFLIAFAISTVAAGCSDRIPGASLAATGWTPVSGGGTMAHRSLRLGAA
jgi:hypothetical protein